MDQTEKKESYWSRGGTTTRYSVIQFTSSISHFYNYYCQVFYFFKKKKKEQKLWKIQLLNIQAEHDKSRQSGTRVGDYSWVANERKSWFSEETCNYDVNRYILMCLPWFFFLLKHDLLLFFVCALPKHTILNQSTPKTVFVCTITNWNKGKSWPIAIFFTAEFIKNYGSNSDCSI